MEHMGETVSLKNPNSRSKTTKYIGYWILDTKTKQIGE